ncbi:MAG: hypothetical protein ACRD22_19000, partial [Terriglobia bacterium]
CGVLCVAGIGALGVSVVQGHVHGAVAILLWFFALAGAYQFGRAAFSRAPPQRAAAELPAPSEAVRRYIESEQRVAAIKAYRVQTGASLVEAQNVLERHWA